jgi:hypothetical protein
MKRKAPPDDKSGRGRKSYFDKYYDCDYDK